MNSVGTSRVIGVVHFNMNIRMVLIFIIVLLLKANGDQMEETTTELGSEISSEVGNEITESATEKHVLSHTIQTLNRYNDELNEILHEKLKNYTDLKILPDYYGPATDVQADVEIREILEISEVYMQIKLNLVIDIRWMDPHLMFEHVEQNDGTNWNAEDVGLWVGNLVKDKIWTPTISILNEKESSGHSKAFVEESLYWRPSGVLLRRVNMVTTVSCSMSLEDFPMDEQNCSILIGSPNYADNELNLTIRPFLNPVFSNTAHNVKLLGWRVSSLVHKGDGPNRTTYAYELLLRRHVGYYIIGTFFPSALVVFISWLTFWMAREAAGERMALGVTCVLTITTLLISSQASSPKVSYVKAIDIYMGVCFTLVFTTLLQSTFIGYLLRKVRIRDAVKKLEEIKNNSAGPPRRFASVVRRLVAGDMEANEEPKIINFILRCDIWCRLMYPAMFSIFNAAYWTYYLPGSRFDTRKGWNFPESYANVSDSRIE